MTISLLLRANFWNNNQYSDKTRRYIMSKNPLLTLEMENRQKKRGGLDKNQ
jgi:hypothetical protein